jgi:nitrite reductase/ring-hydroxylating ferredoxin subunit
MFAVFLLFLTSLMVGGYLYWRNQDNIDAKIYDTYRLEVDTTSFPTIGTVPMANSEGGVISSLSVPTSPYCPSGTSYNKSTGQCEGSVCPSKADFYNSSTGKCERDQCFGLPRYYDSPTGTLICLLPACPVWPERSSAAVGYNKSTGKCESDPICNWGIYNPSVNKCQNFAFYCPPPTYYDPYNYGLRCVANLSPCPSGTTYNPSFGVCAIDPPPLCVSGGCPGIFCPYEIGAEYNPYTNRCEWEPGCPGRMVLNPFTDKCEIDPECPPGSIGFVPELGSCKVPTSCPSRYSLNPSTGLCEAPPQDCPSGTTFNPSTGTCQGQAITRGRIKVQMQQQ